MTLKPISKTTLSEQVAGQIGEMISSGQWKSGDRLPSEAELSKGLLVSRSTIREALKSLAFIGLVQMRTGQGTYVAGSAPRSIDHLLAHGVLNTEKELTDLIDARMALETELATLCVQRATDQELQHLGQLIKEMENSLQGSGKEFLDLDLQFHLSIAAYSKSQVLAQLLRTIRGLLQEFIKKSAQMPGDRDLAYAGHLKIFEALRQRNCRKARAAMRDHLQDSLRRYRAHLRTSTADTQVLV
jgi:GntR family transcriptional repressor for pyruvate dehydrogenase complex